MVDALFVDMKGIYPELLGAEHCWGEERDARTYTGDGPVVAHPPCNLWVNYAAVNWKRYGRQRPAWYPGGTDEGCFASALACVRRFGGVLEHPAGSHAWEWHQLVTPFCQTSCSHTLEQGPHGAGWGFGFTPTGTHRVGFKEYVAEVWQSAYGHAARKRTWLLYCGARAPFELNWDREPGTHQVGWFDRNKPTLSKKAASATPRAFAAELITLAEWSRG